MNRNTYYRTLILDTLMRCATPLMLPDVVDGANRSAINGGAKPADLAGLSGRVANILLRGLMDEGIVCRRQPGPSESSAIRYELTDTGRATLGGALAARVGPPPFPRPVSVDMAAMRAAAGPARTRKAARDAEARDAADFCRDFMRDAAATLNRVNTEIDSLKRKYEARYREVRTPK